MAVQWLPSRTRCPTYRAFLFCNSWARQLKIWRGCSRRPLLAIKLITLTSRRHQTSFSWLTFPLRQGRNTVKRSACLQSPWRGLSPAGRKRSPSLIPSKSLCPKAPNMPPCWQAKHSPIMNGKFPSDKRKPKPVFLHDLSSLGLDFFGAVLIYTSILTLQCSWRVDSLCWGEQDKRVAEDVKSQTHISLPCTLNWFMSLQQDRQHDNSDFFTRGSGGGWLQIWGDIGCATSGLIKTKASPQVWNLPWWLPQVMNTIVKLLWT